MPARRQHSTDIAPASPSPVIEHLDRRASERILRANSVGRLAYAFRNRVDIEPIHYVYRRGRIYGRTSPGTKMSTIAHSPWVAFEVDTVHGPFDWESVVVHGTFGILHQDGGAVDRRTWRLASTALKRVMPEAWTPRDPVPHRSILFQVSVDSISGRRARRTSCR